MTTKLKIKFSLPGGLEHNSTAQCMGHADVTSFVELERVAEFKDALQLLGSEVLEEERVEV